MKPKEYLGDAVYVQNDGFGVILTTENGIRVTNEIYLEPDVYQRLVEYMDRCVRLTMTDELTNNGDEPKLP